MTHPNFTLENTYKDSICGIDEVGRGPLAGPVVAAAVIIPLEKRTLPFISDIRDSKKLSRKKLEYLYHHITEHCLHAIAEIGPQEIDEINILQASLKAMSHAANDIGPVTHALIDGNKIPKNLPCPATAIIKGDSKSVSIAAASIIAKVHRDRLMAKLALEHPHYGWERNVGYPSKEHIQAIQTHGITPHHRKSFGIIKSVGSKPCDAG